MEQSTQQMQDETNDRRRVFIQYLNPEITSLYGAYSLETKHALRAALHVTRYAFLLANELLVLPATYLYEVRFIDAFLEAVDPLCAAQLIGQASSSADVSRLLEKKRREYRDELDLFPDYNTRSAQAKRRRDLVWVPRVKRSSSRDITAAWRSELNNGGLWQTILARHAGNFHPLSKWEKAIDSVPDRLDARAFIPRFSAPLLPFDLTTAERTEVDLLENRAYLLSYVEELGAMILVQTPVGALDLGLSSHRPDGSLLTFSYKRMKAFFDLLGIRQSIETHLTWPQLIRLRSESPFEWAVETLLKDTGGYQLRDAVLKAGFRTPSPVVAKSSRIAYLEVVDRLWRFYDQVFPALQQRDHDYRLVGLSSQPNDLSSRRGATKDTEQLIIPILTTEERMPNKVFLVHGRDANTVRNFKELLRAANITPIDWEKAVGWTEAKSTATTLQIVEAGIANTSAVVVLFTPDDIVQLRPELVSDKDAPVERDKGYQPRPNVLVEAGMALAVGRTRTVLVQVGGTRPISDLSEINHIWFDGSPESRQKLFARLTTAGCRPELTGDYFTIPFQLPRLT
jgi:predicted nucleotide-binding protein